MQNRGLVVFKRDPGLAAGPLREACGRHGWDAQGDGDSCTPRRQPLLAPELMSTERHKHTSM